MLSEGSLAGGLAEYVEIPAANLVALPDQVELRRMPHAAHHAYLTAYRALFVRAGLQPGMACPSCCPTR